MSVQGKKRNYSCATAVYDTRKHAPLIRLALKTKELSPGVVLRGGMGILSSLYHLI